MLACFWSPIIGVFWFFLSLHPCIDVFALAPFSGKFYCPPTPFRRLDHLLICLFYPYCSIPKNLFL